MKNTKYFQRRIIYDFYLTCEFSWIEVQAWFCCATRNLSMVFLILEDRWALLYQPKRAIAEANFCMKAVGTADRDRRVKSFEVSSRWQFPLYQWYGMGVWCIPSLALIRRSSFSPMARHGIRSRDRERAHVRVKKFFAWFNFRWCARATKIKQREKLKGEVYLTQKFPDLRYNSTGRKYAPISEMRLITNIIIMTFLE